MRKQVIKMKGDFSDGRVSNPKYDEALANGGPYEMRCHCWEDRVGWWFEIPELGMKCGPFGDKHDGELFLFRYVNLPFGTNLMWVREKPVVYR